MGWVMDTKIRKTMTSELPKRPRLAFLILLDWTPKLTHGLPKKKRDEKILLTTKAQFKWVG